ncbi:hypothetical protein AY599_25400 [Leptolyngbya valderiana BDU 20041]|nr:hypothetical protein AY599_25400 [Leptolyngbya valderiana BDU 20041]
MHHLIVESLDPDQPSLAIEGEQARHAVRVRRMEPGEPLVLLDGAGGEAQAVVEGSDKQGPQSSWRLLVRITEHRIQPRPRPAVHVVCPAPKGDLLETMIDQLSQVGAASWRPLDCERSEREPRPGKFDRLTRITHESAKQCGRAWFMELESGIPFAEAVQLPNTVLASADGKPAGEVLERIGAGSAAESIHVLVGPEGGFSDAERRLALEAELSCVRLGPHVLRIGTAAVIAASAFVRAADGS